MMPNLLAASVQGASHIRNGIECQDSYKKVSYDDGTVIMAVADGHGSKSCPHSKTGSSIAVNVFCKLMEDFHENYSGNLDALLTYLNRESETKVAQAIDLEWKRRVLKIHTNNKRPQETTEGIKDKEKIYHQYGSTLLGMMITPLFVFSFQLGDGNLIFVDENGVNSILDTETILGVETHSLCKMNAWKKAVSSIQRINMLEYTPALIMISTDGFLNSYKNDDEFQKTCTDYFEMIKEHGAKTISSNMKEWLSETSELGCGDDITLLMAYFN